MENASGLKVLLVAEGSGGHLIPALEVANTLAKTGARITVWYAQRQPTVALAAALTQGATDASVDVHPIPVDASNHLLGRLWHCGQLWHRAGRCFDTFSPDVVVGFGGWVSAPVVLAACLRPANVLWRSRQDRHRRIGCLLHEQNVVMGRANRLLAHWVDRIALSFRETQSALGARPSVITGLPIRAEIGQGSRAEASSRFGFMPDRPTLLVLGGSQGARAINHLAIKMAVLLSPEERRSWQMLHLTGSADAAAVKEAYAAAGVTAWVAPFLGEMGAAYAQADVVIARAGASTIAELSRCGTPSILIPYPFAGGHQRANAQLVEGIGGGLMIEESHASPERVLRTVRVMVADPRLRHAMGEQMRALHSRDATTRLTDAILELARTRVPQTHPDDAHP